MARSKVQQALITAPLPIALIAMGLAAYGLRASSDAVIFSVFPFALAGVAVTMTLAGVWLIKRDKR